MLYWFRNIQKEMEETLQKNIRFHPKTPYEYLIFTLDLAPQLLRGWMKSQQLTKPGSPRQVFQNLLYMNDIKWMHTKMGSHLYLSWLEDIYFNLKYGIL